MLNDSDGYYGGSHNFYIYDEGAPGYVFLPTDMDSALAWLSLFTTVGASSIRSTGGTSRRRSRRASSA